MQKKKRDPNTSGDIAGSVRVGDSNTIRGGVNISGRDSNYVAGNVTIGGGDFVGRDVISSREIAQLFEQILYHIETRPNTPAAVKEDLKAEVKEIEYTLAIGGKKNEEVDERFLSRRFRNIARMAPDVLDVIVAALVNPLAGLGVAVKKIAEKAKEETR